MEKVRPSIYIDLGKITKLDCDCIVNAANCSLLGGGGVDGAIHRAAGSGLLKECEKLHGCKRGEAKITKGYNLPAKYVIHTVGPIYTGSANDATTLHNCYYNSLALARKHDIHSIAFSAISTGVYGYPLKEATKIAVSAVEAWLKANSDYTIKIIFSCFTRDVYDSYKEILAGK